MLAKKYRLPVQHAVSKKSASARSRYFLLRIFPKQLVYGRVAVVVSKKVSPKASVRNQIKRLVYDFFRSRIKTLQNDLIITPLPAIAEIRLDSRAIIKELENLTKTFFYGSNL